MEQTTVPPAIITSDLEIDSLFNSLLSSSVAAKSTVLDYTELSDSLNDSLTAARLTHSPTNNMYK
jgi:hypothetical protein